MELGFVKKRKIITNFNFGNISLNGGIVLLKKINKKTRFIKKIASKIQDYRVNYKCKHSIFSMITQRVFALALGQKNLNNHNQIRNDLLMQTVLGYDKVLASPATLCRFEGSINKKNIIQFYNIFIKNFIQSHKKNPKKIILDFDGTECKVYGNQKGSMYNGYFKHKCYFPLYVFCGKHLLIAHLRPGNVTDSKYSWGFLKFLVNKIRKSWPNVKIIFRGDSAFCRNKIFNWCEENNIGYITGISKNNILKKLAKNITKKNKAFPGKTKKNQKFFYEFKYGAKSWRTKRKIILKAESNNKESKTNFIVTNLDGTPKQLYKKVYCGRCEVENRIKEQKLYLFSNCTSGKDMKTNQFRLLLSAIAYTLLNDIRLLCLKNTKYAKATCSTIRNNLLKIGVIVVRELESIRISFIASYSFSIFFRTVFRKLEML